MLRPEQADTFRSKASGHFSIRRCVGIGPYTEISKFIHNLHELLEIWIFRGVHHGQLTRIHIPLGTIKRYGSAFFIGFPIDDHFFGGCVDMNHTGTHNATFSPATSHKGRVACHATTRGQDPLCGSHAGHIFRIGLFSD